MSVPITAQQIRMAAKTKPNEANMQSVLTALERYAVDVALNQPHRLVHFMAQLMHESGAFRWDQEIWGPTPAQQRYDTRTDVGNTPERDGDGFKYRGRAGIQITGKDNYRQFRDWCRAKGYNAPDFVANADAVNTDPWEGLAPIWYWDTRKLNQWADQNDIETITKKINGGKNGLADRIDYYGRLALVVCGYGVTESEVKRFQLENGLDVDGDIGPKTRAALHKRLVGLGGAQSAEVRAAPVVEEKIVETVVPVEIEKQVVPVKVEEKVKEKSNILTWLTGGGGISTLGLGWLTGMDWRAIVAGGVVLIVVLLLFVLLRTQIVSAVREIKAEVG